MRLKKRLVYQTPVGLVTAVCHVTFAPVVRYLYQAHVGDRTIQAWAPTKDGAQKKFELTLEKWLSEGAK